MSEPLMAQSDSNTSENEPLAIDKEISFQGGFTGSQSVELGDLAVGKLVQVYLNAVNRSGGGLKIRNVRASCSCTKVEVKRKVVPADESIELRISLTVPTQAYREARAVPVYVEFEDETPEMQLAVRFRIDNLACFATDTVLYQVRPNKRTESIKLPLVVSKSIDISKFRLRATGDFADGKFKIEREGNELYAVSDFTFDEFPNGGFSGQLVLENLVSKTSDEVRVLIQMQSQLELSPAVLRFTPDDVDATKRLTWKSMAILRLLEENAGSKPIVDETRKLPSIKAELDHCMVETELIALSRELFRLKLKVIPDHTAIDWKMPPSEMILKVDSSDGSHNLRRSVRWLNE